MILGGIDSNSFRNLWKVKVLLYVICVEVISVLSMEEKMISIDIRTPQSIRYKWCCTRRKKINWFWSKLSNYKLSSKVLKVEMLSSGFLVEHNLPLRTRNHTAKLLRNMFPDFKIVNKSQCDCIKTTHMLSRAVSERITSDLKEVLLLTCWYGLAKMKVVIKITSFCPF